MTQSEQSNSFSRSAASDNVFMKWSSINVTKAINFRQNKEQTDGAVRHQIFFHATIVFVNT